LGLAARSEATLCAAEGACCLYVNLPWLTSAHLKSPVSGLIIVDEFQVLALEILSGIRRDDQGRIS
jgi:hypothetical protein